MTDYSKNEDYAAKDALATGDPDKLILGTEIDAEFAELVTAVASKFDSSDIASIAEAQAMVSNTTLITPARLGSALTGSGAGALADILALTDPGADRILFWDDSDNEIDWLVISTGLQITGNNLTSKDSEINHNALLNYDANKHVDHTGVTFTAGSGLSGGGDLSASRTFDLDLTELTVAAAVDTTTDYLWMYDASVPANRKVLVGDIAGVALGDGQWYRSTAQAVAAATSTDIIFDTAVYDSLTRGTYSTSTGVYTAGASGARILLTATMAMASLGAGRSQVLQAIRASGVEAARVTYTSQGGTATTPGLSISIPITLGPSETAKLQAYSTLANSIAGLTAGGYFTTLGIVEIG